MSQFPRQVLTAGCALLGIHWFGVAQIPLSPTIWSMWAKFQMPLTVFRAWGRGGKLNSPLRGIWRLYSYAPALLSPLNKTFCTQKWAQSPAGTIPKVLPASWQPFSTESSGSAKDPALGFKLCPLAKGMSVPAVHDQWVLDHCLHQQKPRRQPVNYNVLGLQKKQA